MAIKIPNDNRRYQHFPTQGLPKYSQIRIFRIKIYHLASEQNERTKNLHQFRDDSDVSDVDAAVVQRVREGLAVHRRRRVVAALAQEGRNLKGPGFDS
jgi:hypothetical protein